jgi:hypothetical protein
MPGMPGFEECTPEQREQWARHISAAAEFFYAAGDFSFETLRLIADSGIAGAQFVSGFYTELMDSLTIIPFISMSRCAAAQLAEDFGIDPDAVDTMRYYQRQPSYILGQWFGRGTAYTIALLELGFATVGMLSSGGVLTTTGWTGVGAIAATAGATLSTVVAIHGTLVLIFVLHKPPLPNVVFASADNGHSDAYGTKAERQQLAEDLAEQTGGRLGEVQGEGRKITWEGEARGRRNIVSRLMDSGGVRNEPYWRISINGIGSFSLDGRLITTNDPLLVHHAYTGSTKDDLLRLLDVARTWKR